jgi:hypothetical protein
MKKKIKEIKEVEKNYIEVVMNRLDGEFKDNHFIKINPKSREGGSIFLKFKDEASLRKFGNSFMDPEELCSLLCESCLDVKRHYEEVCTYRVVSKYVGVVKGYSWYLDNDLLGEMFNVLKQKECQVFAYSYGYDLDVKCQTNKGYFVRRRASKKPKYTSHYESDNWRSD